MSRTFFLGIVFVSTLIDATVFSLSFFPRRQGHARIELKSLARSIAATSFVFVLKLFPLIVMGLTIFGLIHLIYIDLVALAPALALVALIWRWKRSTPTVRFVAIVCLVPRDRRRVRDLRRTIRSAAGNRRSRRPARTRRDATDSDRRARRHSNPRRLGSRTERRPPTHGKKPDLVLIAGDVFQGDDDSFERALPALRGYSPN